MAKNKTVKLSNEWKISLSADKHIPAVTKVSLYDMLFFINKDNKTCVRFNEGHQSSLNKNSVGKELNHNVILFDTLMYVVNEDREIRSINQLERYAGPETPDETSTTFGEWQERGIDVSLPVVDKRSKPLLLDSSNITDYLSAAKLEDFEDLLDIFDLQETQQLNIYDENALKKPQTTREVYTNSVLFEKDHPPIDDWEDYQEPFLIATEEDTQYEIKLKKELIDENDEDEDEDEIEIINIAKNSDIILCHNDRFFEEKFLVEDSGKRAFNGMCFNYLSKNIWMMFFRYYNPDFDLEKAEASFDRVLNHIGGISDDLSIEKNLNPVLEFLLKNCFVWIKASFFADYVDYRDFGQSLHRDASVIHRNLMLSRFGKWERYLKEIEAGVGFQEGKLTNLRNSRPYLPSTTPSIDLIKETVLLQDGLLTGEVDEDMSRIIKDADSPHSNIGAIPFEPFEVEDISFEANILPVSGKPPLWFDPESRNKATDYKDFPIIFPKDENLILGGRVLSPTIDELWKMIKEVVSGRASDNDKKINFPGYPRGEESTKTDFDSRPSIRRHQFETNGESKVGDPTNIKYSLENGIASYSISSWVNDPSKIEYDLVEQLQELSEGLKIPEDFEAPPKHDPEKAPMSLRELEGYLKGIRWNFEYFLSLFEEVSALNGKYGDTEVGSLHMLHKDFKREPENNTKYSGDSSLGNLEIDKGQETPAPWSVYLGADGQWHSSSQCLLLPVVEEDF